MATLNRNIYGWCVRDTMNDGLGNMSGTGTRAMAEAWARKWHAAAPDKRVVLDDSLGLKWDAEGRMK